MAIDSTTLTQAALGFPNTGKPKTATSTPTNQTSIKPTATTTQRSDLLQEPTTTIPSLVDLNKQATTAQKAATPTAAPASTQTMATAAQPAATSTTQNWTVDKTKTPILNGMADDGGQVYEGSSMGAGRVATAIGGQPRIVTIAQYQALIASNNTTTTGTGTGTGTGPGPGTGTTQPTGTGQPTNTNTPTSTAPAGGVAGNGQGDPNNPFNGTYGPNGERYWNEDQGTGNFRTDVSPGRNIPENTTQSDGSIQGNYKDSRGNYYNAFAETAASMSPMEIERMQAAAAAANGRTMTQDEMSSKQLNDILAQDSPLMSLARQDGITLANSRGAMNSSLAAGASMAEMARQASPLALQQAEAYRQMQEQNQNLESQRLEANAGRDQQSNMFNADAENQATSQEFTAEAQRRQNNAAMLTDTNVKNAAMSNDMLAKDRSLSMSYALQQLAGDQDYSKQQLASTLAKDIAKIESDNKALISGNDSAARVLTSMTEAIADIVSNKDISGGEATTKIQAIIDSTKDSLNVISAMNNLNLGGLI